jgi:adenylate kinase family enzyme
MVILLIGQQGTGKSTLGRSLEDLREVTFVSGGVLIRREIASLSELGGRIEAPIARGRRVPPKLSYAMLAGELAGLPGQDLVLDGFPYAAEEHEELAAVAGDPDLVLLLEGVPTHELVRRIEWRIECKGCYRAYRRGEQTHCRDCGIELRQRPEDGDRERIARRHSRWTKSEKALVHLYDSLDILRRLDASVSPQQILGQALVEIDRRKNSPS